MNRCNMEEKRRLPVSGGYNFRDLGGYRTREGREVVWGRVFRSDELHRLTDDDLAYLSAIPLRTLVDFRAPQEIEHAPDRFPASLTQCCMLPIAPGNLSAGLPDLSGVDAHTVRKKMREMNELFVTDAVCLEQYRRFFGLLQDEASAPLMFHCSAGKDRTGMGAALFLAALGVDEETILADYMLSERYLGDKYTPLVTRYPGLKPVFEVHAEYLQAGLTRVRTTYGTMEQFLQGVLSVDTEKMRQLYLK